MAETSGITIREATAADLEEAQRLLREARLIALDETSQFGGQYAVAVDGDGALVGLAGYERYGTDVLLRSVVVREALRGLGVGRKLVEDRLRKAAREGAGEAYLLTETAREYWARVHGFREIARGAAPVAITQSREWSGACPASATAMRRGMGRLGE